MRKLGTPILLALLGTTLTWLAPGCGETTCTQDSPYLEMLVSFSGFNLASARRIELETTVVATPPTGTQHEYLDTRRGSLVFPAEGRDGELTLLIDPGAYITSLGDATYHLTFIVRVFGERGGEPSLLLAEGRFSDALTVTGCHMELPLAVTTTPTCVQKTEGEPCVGSGGTPAVCVVTGGSLTCVESLCGDGFTDRRQGEICDPGQTAVGCDENCIPAPIELEVSPDTTSAALHAQPAIANTVQHDTEVRGLFELEFTADASPTVAGALLIADLDGDSADEIVWAAPEGIPFDQVAGSGKVTLKDWPVIGDMMIGSPDRAFTTIHAQVGSEPTWLGASLAAGDVNGDGVQDLLMGAPLDDQRAGILYVVYGGAAQQLSPASNQEVIELGSVGDYGKYQAIRGDQGQIGAMAPGDHLGYALATGDFDGDGVTDVAVGAPGRSDPAIISRGEVYLLRGGQHHWQTGDHENVLGVAELRLHSYRDGARLGVALAAGDLDGDGLADLIIGSEVSRDPAASMPGYGAAFVLFGTPGLFDDPGASVNVDNPPVDAGLDLLSLVAGSAAADEYGIGGAAAVGDLDGDGLGELALTLGRRGSVVSPHTVIIVPGTAIAHYRETGTPPDLATEALWLEGTAEEAFGAFLHFADVNRDGTADLLIGAPRYTYVSPPAELREQAGAIYMLLGSSRAPFWEVSKLRVEDAFSGTPPVGLPWIRLYGAQARGLFGTSAAVSAQLGQLQLDDPRPRTFVLAPGWSSDPTDPGQTNQGYIWAIDLLSLLPCESRELCTMD